MTCLAGDLGRESSELQCLAEKFIVGYSRILNIDVNESIGSVLAVVEMTRGLQSWKLAEAEQPLDIFGGSVISNAKEWSGPCAALQIDNFGCLVFWIVVEMLEIKFRSERAAVTIPKIPRCILR